MKMEHLFCKHCNRFLGHEHVCPPQWLAVRPDTGDPDDEATYYKTFGSDAEAAAIDLAQRKFANWDYFNEVEVWVKKENEDWIKFKIEVEPVPHFTATEIKLMRPGIF